jgi:hypothetical protein
MFASVPIYADNAREVLSEEMVLTALDSWREYENSGDISAAMDMLSQDVIIEAHLPYGGKWSHYQIPKDVYEKIITKALPRGCTYSYIREREQINVAEDGLSADSIAIVFEREEKNGVKSCTKTTEEMSFKVLDGKLKIVRMSGVVWDSC